jgi:hypothetical protein
MALVQKLHSREALKILKWWRHWKQIRQIEDPITLDKIQGKPFVFISKVPPYLQYTFGAETLSAYQISSLNFHNPLTREKFNFIEIYRLHCLSGNPETWSVYHNRAQLVAEKELNESALKSYEWDIEEAVNTILIESEEITDQCGLADARDVDDIMHEIQSEVFPDVALAFRCILEYEKRPRMDNNIAVSVASKMVDKLRKKESEPPYVDSRILNFLCKFFQNFIDSDGKISDTPHLLGMPFSELVQHFFNVGTVNIGPVNVLFMQNNRPRNQINQDSQDNREPQLSDPLVSAINAMLR